LRSITTVILAFDTSTPACTVALFAADGHLFSSRDEVIGRGHAERLVPLIAEMLAGHMPSQLLVGVGPGSFTGLRIAIAAAHGLGIGWDVPVHGMSSIALLAASAPGDGPVAAALAGGHGELFVQQFRRDHFKPTSELLNLPAAEAARVIDAPLVVGTGAQALVAARGHGEALPLLPSAANVLRLPPRQRSLDPKPLYARAPDARPREAA
jgi:tRNA threonylcarbamoyladenosine biosynthesis protein TsaB